MNKKQRLIDIPLDYNQIFQQISNGIHQNLLLNKDSIHHLL